MSRNSRSNATGYNIRCRLYPSVIENGREIVRKLDLISSRTFYAKDYQTFSYTQNQYGNMQRVVKEGVIETMDLFEGDIKINDTVEYEGVKYNVGKVTHRDNNQQKSVSRRPIVKTIIELGAVVNG